MLHSTVTLTFNCNQQQGKTRHVKTRQRQDKTSRDKDMQYVFQIDAGLGLS
jgi:hypothetical protein